MQFKNKKRKRLFIIGTSILSVLVLFFIAGGIYLSIYYHGDRDAIDDFSTRVPVEKQKISDGKYVYTPIEDTMMDTGFIFYPGGKVEAIAYEPLLKSLAAEGVLCVLVEMPFRLAVFDVDAADGIPEQFPKITDWYIGGHSLGGSMAASYLGDATDEYEGLLLFGSYSTEDLSETELKVLSVYGSEDRVLNKKKYEKNKKHLPEDYQEVILAGGCHAYFGMYGAQDGDGTPTISNEEQIKATVDAVMAFLEEK